MKYIKTYENNKYKVGDYVIISITQSKDIIKIPAQINNIRKDYSGADIYNITTHDEYNNKNVLLLSIERKMTPEEIDEFKLKQNINKYNL